MTRTPSMKPVLRVGAAAALSVMARLHGLPAVSPDELEEEGLQVVVGQTLARRERLEAAVGEEDALVDDEEPVRDVGHLGDDVAREDDRAPGLQAPQEVPEGDDLERVEAVRRLVEDDDLRVVDERAGE